MVPPESPLPSIQWGPRNNTNIQQSAILIALNHVAKNKETYLENYWLKNKRAADKGKSGPVSTGDPGRAETEGGCRRGGQRAAPAGSRVPPRRGRVQAGNVDVKPGDYIVRGDQPYRTVADMYFSIQNYAPSNPRPYDDTGLDVPAHAQPGDQADRGQERAEPADGRPHRRHQGAGGVEGTGPVLIVDHTTDNALVTLRFKHKDVAMEAAEEEFEAAGRKFRAGAFIIKNANRRRSSPR